MEHAGQAAEGDRARPQPTGGLAFCPDPSRYAAEDKEGCFSARPPRSFSARQGPSNPSADAIKVKAPYARSPDRTSTTPWSSLFLYQCCCSSRFISCRCSIERTLPVAAAGHNFA